MIMTRFDGDASKLYRVVLLTLILAHATPKIAGQTNRVLIESVRNRERPCRRSSECEYPRECCFYKEYKGRFTYDANGFAQVEGKCCVPAGGTGNFFGRGEAQNPYGSYNRFSSLTMNAWYFWFIIIFLLLSCLGLCGYWRRRQWILSFQNSHRAAPLSQQQQQRHHHHQYQLPLTHPLSLTTGGGSAANRPSPLPPLSANSSGHRVDFASGVGLPIADPNSNPLQRHHPRDPRGFVAPPDFNLYAAHASIRAPAMFSPGPTRIASQLYSVSSTTTSGSTVLGAAATGVHPPPLSATMLSGNVASLGGCIGGRADEVTPVGLPPSYVEAVSGAADSKHQVAGSPANVNDKKMADLPPSYAEAVAQMMHQPVRAGEGRGVVDVLDHGPVASTASTAGELSPATILTHERIQSLRTSGSAAARPPSLIFRGNGASATTTTATTSDDTNLAAIYDPITSLGGGNGNAPIP